ncbi:MAG: hypothetical protein L0332_35770 [Chloroflexi bacterium]|nr:hypothetical protein [Chloroflexota bacterium]
MALEANRQIEEEPVAISGNNYFYVNGVFAPGNGATPMFSSSYQSRGTVGEVGLPYNETNLSSQNYQHQPGFLAAAPSTPTPPGPTGTDIFLPTVLHDFTDYFEGPWEVEDNDTAAQANGPLRSAQDYFGYPNDIKDYFSLYMPTNGVIVVNLMNHTGQGVQLQLFYQSTNNLVVFDTTPPFQVQHSGPAGLYYIYIFTASGHNSTMPYTLRVTYP